MTPFDETALSPVRVMCLGPQRLQTSLMASALGCQEQVESLEWSVSIEEALSQAAAADVVVLLPAEQVDGGVAWIRALSAAHPGLRLVVAGIRHDETLVVACVEAGATACVTERQGVGELLEAIQAVQRDQGYLDPSLTPALLRRLATLRQASVDPQTAAQRLDGLTPREHEVLAMMSLGWSNAAIASRLHIAVGTVKNHVHSILRKLKASGRWEAAGCLQIAGRSTAFDPEWPLAWGPWPNAEALPLEQPSPTSPAEWGDGDGA